MTEYDKKAMEFIFEDRRQEKIKRGKQVAFSIILIIFALTMFLFYLIV